MIGDEKASGFHHSSGGQFYNNIVINMGTLFWVPNNTFNYNTQLNKCYIGHNTFVGGDKTQIGIRILGNAQGRPHKDSLFENNVIVGAPTIGVANGDVSGIAFRNNLWSKTPAAAMRGPGDRIGDPNLVNPRAKLNNPYPDPFSNIDPKNYQLTTKSSLAIAQASGGGGMNGLQPPTVVKDFFGATRGTRPDIGAHEFGGIATLLTANFSIGPGQESGKVPHTVDFIDKSAGDRPIVSRTWDFGDGETSHEMNPSHTYTTAGRFDVSLTLTDDAGKTDTFKEIDLISVARMPSPILPNLFRRFVLLRTKDNAVVAYGTQYPDMRCILLWNSDPFHILNYDDVEDVELSIVELGKVELFWIDPNDQDATAVGDEERELIVGSGPLSTILRG
jgi:PKD repeat protein